ncbi:MAG TPA: hypothetical protein VD816_01255, partial [Ohtaekwangia sp.]|nr:hypothetical protein [Ohtaekwangia sp.]
IFDKMEASISKRSGKSHDVTLGGLEGREISYGIGDEFFRAMLLRRENTLYMLMTGPSKDVANSAAANKFFASFRTKPFKETDEHDFIDPKGAFSVRMKGKVNSNVLRPDNPDGSGKYELHLFYSADGRTGETRVMRFNDFPAGYISSNDSVYYEQMVHTVIAQMKGYNLFRRDIDIRGFKGHAFTFDVSADARTVGKMVLRGNRYYLMIATAPAGQSLEENDFLTSFRFLPYEQTAVKSVAFPQGITLTVPKTFFAETTSGVNTENTSTYNILDEKTGILYVVSNEEVSLYEEQRDIESFFKPRQSEFLSDNDSVIAEKIITEKGYVFQETYFRSRVSNAIRRLKIILAGRKLYSLLAYLPADHAQSNLPEKFFGELGIEPQPTWSVLTDKTDLLMKDLASKDSTTRALAKQAIAGHRFEKEDLPKIYDAIRAMYPDDVERYTSTKEKLFSVLEDVNDETTVDFIKEVYHHQPDSTPARDVALSVLASLKTQAACLEIVDLFNADESQRKFNGYTVLYPFYDSLSLLNYVLPDLLIAEARFEYAYPLLDLAKMALDSGALSADVEKRVIEMVHRIGKEISQGILPGSNDENGRFSALAGLMSAVPFDPDVRAIVEALHRSGDIPTMVITGGILLRNGVALKKEDVDRIANHPLYRFRFYEILKTQGKEKLYNARHLSREKFAESDLWEYMDYDEGLPEISQLVKVMNISYQGKRQALYAFKYRYAEDETWYIGISGPYPLKSKILPPRGEMTFASYETFTDEKQMRDVVESLIVEYGATLQD